MRLSSPSKKKAKRPKKDKKSLSSVGELISGYRQAKVLFSAVELGIFEGLSSGSKTAQDVATAFSLDPRACEILMDALVPMGFLQKSSGKYKNSLVTKEHVLRDAPASFYHNLRYQNMMWKDWEKLEEVVRTGHPPERLPSMLEGVPFTDQYIRAMVEVAREPSKEVANFFAKGEVTSVLDVGGGHGEYGLALLRQHPASRLVILDVPPTLRVTERLLTNNPLRDRVELRAGDYKTADFGRDQFDLVLFSHVTHDEGPQDNQELFAKAFQSLRVGGKAAVHDFMVSKERTKPLFGALFSTHMLVYTSKGRTYRVEDYASWLKGAGFKGLEYATVGGSSPNASMLIAATKQ